MKVPGILMLFLAGSTVTWGQSDSSEVLREATISDYRITADQSLKERQFTSDSLELGTRQTLAEALKYQSSIFVKSYGGNGVATLSLRGTGASHTRVFWNNLELGSPMLGLADLSLLPLSGFDGIDLQYGFASLSDGSGALGGSLRLQNHPDLGKKSKLELQQTLGSFGRFQTAASAEIGQGRLRSETKVYRFQADNDFRYPDISEKGQPQRRMQHADLLQHGIQQSLYYRLSDKEVLSVKSWLKETDRKLPPTLTADPEQYDVLKDQSIAAIAEYQRFDGRSQWLLNTGLVRSHNIFENRAAQNTSDNAFLSWQSNLRLKHRHTEKLGSEHGIHARRESASSPAYLQTAERNNFSAFSRWSFDILPRLSLHTLLRQEWVGELFSPLLGSFGLVWKQDDHLIRLNLARNYRFPTLNDLYWQPGGNPDLKPEQSWSLEGGYYWKWNPSASFSQQFSITAFYNWVDDWIQWVPRQNFTTPANLKKVENTGLEVESMGSLKLGSWKLSNNLSYTYTRSRATAVYGDGAKAGQLSFVPFHKLAAGLALVKNQWEFRYQQSFNGMYFTTASNNVYMPAYHIAGITAAYRDLIPSETHQLKLAVSIQNLYDLPYQVLPYRPEPGIQFNLSLKYGIEL